MAKRLLGLGGLLIGIAVLWVLNCSGPRAEIVGVRLLDPVGPGEPYFVEMTLQNQGPGKGEVEVTVQLRDNDRTFPGSHKAKLDVGEELTLMIPVESPAARYTVAAEVEYPPR